MSWTQAQVVEALVESGIDVSERQLTDWRQEGLLPKLEPIRDAHGRMSYVWNQSNILEHVRTVSELIAYYERISRFAHILWLLGYEVRPGLVMEGIRAPIGAYWAFWSGGDNPSEQSFDEDKEDELLARVNKLAETIARRRERRPAGYPNFEDAVYQLYRSLSAMIDPLHPPDEVIIDLAAQGKSTTILDEPPDAMQITFVEFFQRYLTPRHLADVVAKATWEEFCVAGDDVSILREIITLSKFQELAQSRIGDVDPAVWIILRNGMLSMLGHWIVAGDISLRQAGYGHLIRAYLRWLRRKMRKFDFPASVQQL